MSTSPLLVLASASPRRHEILNTIGLPHEIMVAPDPSGLDEPMRTGESPQDYVRRTAREKVLRTAALVGQRPDAGKQQESGNGAEHLPYILGADTCVILDEEILGKPADIDDAAGMLKRLSGRTHTVRTAVAVWHDEQLLETESVTTVQFTELSDEDIRNYCATGECWGKAGAYGIQGHAARFVSHLGGSYTGVVGLPAFETVALLRQAGYPT